MVREIFGVTDIQPIWKKQNREIDYLYLKFVISLFSLLIVLWFTLITWMSLINIRILDLANKTPGILIILNKGWVSLLFGLFASVLYIFYLQFFTEYFSDIDLLEEFTAFYRDLTDNLYLTIEDPDKNEILFKVLLIYLYLIFQGVFGGMIATLILFVPFFVISIFFSFILVYFLGFNSVSLTIGSIITWFVLVRLFMRSRLVNSEKEIEEKVERNYKIRRRNLEIIASSEPPVVCPACKSFVSSQRDNCNVCGEVLSKVRKPSSDSESQ